MFKEIIEKLKTWRKGRQPIAMVPDPEPETPVEEIPGDVLVLNDPENSNTEQQPQEKAQKLAVTYEITGNEATELSKAISEALKPFAVAVRHMWECLPKWCRDVLALEIEMSEMKEIATPRQWHLYKHGTPRQQKKWVHALARKAKIRKKRQGGDNR